MKWISVKERLPKERKFVLAYQPHELITCRILILCVIDNLWYEVKDNGDIDISGYFSKITHWMPLPEPPTE